MNWVINRGASVDAIAHPIVTRIGCSPLAFFCTIMDYIYYMLVVALCLGSIFDDIGFFIILWIFISIIILLIGLLSSLLTYIIWFIFNWPVDKFFWAETILLLKFLLLFVFLIFLFLPI